MRQFLPIAALSFCAAAFASEGEETPACPAPLVSELKSAKILGERSALISALTTSPSTIYAATGVGQVLTGSLKAASGNFLLALLPKSVHIADIDHLVIILGKESAISEEDAKAKMSADLMEALRDAVGAVEAEVLKGSPAEFSLKGGFCAPGPCAVNAMAFRHARTLPKKNKAGDYVVITSFGVVKNGAVFFGQNLPMILSFIENLETRGYVAGFWQAETQALYTSSLVCR